MVPSTGSSITLDRILSGSVFSPLGLDRLNSLLEGSFTGFRHITDDLCFSSSCIDFGWEELTAVPSKFWINVFGQRAGCCELNEIRKVFLSVLDVKVGFCG
jgi:hypothetical protein